MTDGLVGSAVNGILFWLYLTGASLGKSKTSGSMYKAFREADQALTEFNYTSFKQILNKLYKQGLIKKSKAYSQLEIEITRKGRERIQRIIPQYQQERPWDGFLYLVSYDIPEIQHVSRNILRKYLKKHGCARLQESLWLTPYNPRKLLDEFADEHRIVGTILLSKLGQDGAVGEESIYQLLDRVYQLSKLNMRYSEFIEEEKRLHSNRFFLTIKYEGILRDDPQLPFELLPKDWRGDDAYRLVQGLQ